MKFPYSSAPAERFGRTVEPGLNSSKDADELRLKIEKARRKIFDAYSKMHDLLEDMFRASMAAVKESGLVFDEKSLAELEREYRDHGFRSKAVKKAVEKVRAAFFDDGLEPFRETMCSKIDFDTGGSVEFFFVHGPSGRSFAIVLPYVSERKDRLFYNYIFDDSSSRIDQAVSDSIEGFALMCPMKHLDSATVAFDYDAKAFRSCVLALADNGFEPVWKSPPAAEKRFFDEYYAPLPRWISYNSDELCS